MRLSIVFPDRRENIEDFAIGDGTAAVWDVGFQDQNVAGDSDIPWHKHIDKINSTYYHYVRYIFKAKVKGFWKGKPVEDKWKHKRLLFKKNLSFKKVGTIGKFWMKPKKVLWQQVKDVEKRIGEGLEQAGMEELVVHVAELTGEPIKDVERTLGYYSDESTIKEWIETIACP
ncbi:MAG: hypothetical protein JKY95_17380 [Planctomycetaceae bacterium]|nr:hypothetical protein [Planctomycetaceae bacterium]